MGFFACGETPFGRRPLYPDDPVNPVQLLSKDKNPFLFLPSVVIDGFALLNLFNKIDRIPSFDIQH